MTRDVDLVRRLTEEGFVKGELDVFDELIADDFVDHDPPPGFPGDKAGMRQLAELTVGAFTDRHLETDEYLEATDGRVVEYWAMTGVHTGEAFGVPPTGAHVRVRGIEMFRCADGKLAEHWGVVDLSDFFEKAQAAAG